MATEDYVLDSMEEECVDEEITQEVAEEEAQEEAAVVGTITEVQDQVFQEILLPEELVLETQKAWNTFLNQASSREAAGEAIYSALFDSAPSLQSLFKTPRAVMAMRFMNGLNTIVNEMHRPQALKITVETLGFQHLDLEVTVPRVVIFRDAIIDLFSMEMGPAFSSRARNGMSSILNYVGGAYIYVRREYAGRLRVIASSWRTANNKTEDEYELAEKARAEAKAREAAGEVVEKETEAKHESNDDKKAAEEDKEDHYAQEGTGLGQKLSSTLRASGEGNKSAMKVPTTYNEMFMFNAAVMGFSESRWFGEVLEVFDDIVTNVANSYRLQECCDTLSLSLAKYNGQIKLPEYKAIMLASLRSLVPKDWDGEHEVAWTWLWDNVERMLKSLMGKPAVFERALERLVLSFTEDNLNYLRREVYQRFFALAPAGQDYFKQSTTRLYWIADRVVEMTLEMYRDPKKMVEDISALGLRHVGYGIPTEFFAPFVSGAVEVVRALNADETAEEAFRFSLSLVSRILVRTINEGSTIVMKAINTNSEKQLNKAVACAPRGKRALWMLNVTVGTQSISPLYWAIESGSLATARAMIVDLLIIRADRDNYYYGCDALFERHTDLVLRLCQGAQTLLEPLFDGLIWRSRVAVSGTRRVNYYVKHLVQDTHKNLSPVLEWIVEAQDTKIICHPVVVLFSDLLWNGLANRYFLAGRLYFVFTLMIFITSQSILQHLHEGQESKAERIATATLRVFIYLFSMGQIFIIQMLKLCKDLRRQNFKRCFGYVPVPAFIFKVKDAVSCALLLCLIIMLSNEPIFYCMSTNDGTRRLAAASASTAGSAQGSPASALSLGLFNQNCEEGRSHKQVYSTVSMVAMLFYWALLIDLSVFSVRISAFVQVCGRVVSEVFLFLGALAFLVLSFSSSISALNHKNKDFAGIPKGALSLLEMALGMFPSSHYETMQEEPIVLIVVCMFTIITLVFLLNLLVAQLNGAYQAVYNDMLGYARLSRGKITAETLANVGEGAWTKFLTSLRFEDRLEFNEGDIGLAGGIQVAEPSNANPTTVDAIRRFGGSTSPTVQWPEEANSNGDDEDKFERLEKVLLKVSKSGGGKKKSNAGSSMGQSSMSGGGSVTSSE